MNSDGRQAIPPEARAVAIGYQHRRGTRTIPANRWTTINDVAAIEGGQGLYVAQFAVSSGRGAVLRVRFNRNGTDGTGDQTYKMPLRGVFNVTHLHSVSGFKGRMQVQVRPSRKIQLRYRIAKSIKL